MNFLCLYALILCLQIYILSSAFKLPENSKIEFQRFEKWPNLSYRYVSYVKSEASDTVKSRIKTYPDIGSSE